MKFIERNAIFDWFNLLVFAGVFIVLALMACGRYDLPPDPYTPPPTPGPVDPAPTDKKVIVAVFGAPWCSACKSQIPNLDQALAKLSPKVRAKVDFRMYVITGWRAQEPPTQEVATKYRDSLHVSASANVDPWRYTVFKKWVGGQVIIPAAVVLNHDESVLKVFRAGDTTFAPSEIAEAARVGVANLKD